MKGATAYLAVLLVILLLSYQTSAQVAVRDSLTVAAPMDTTGREGSSAAVAGRTSLFKTAAFLSLPEGGQIVVTIIGGAGAAVHNLVVRSPIQVTIVQNANANHGFTWTSPVFAPGTTVDIGLVWFWRGMTGSEWGARTTQLNDSTYQIGFEDIGFSPLYVDVIIRVVVRRMPIRLEIATGEASVRPLKTGGPNTTTVVVRALRGTEPVAGVPVELRVEPVPNSGGHDHHDASRPRGRLSATSGVTGADGKFTTTYTASEIAGVEEVIARSPQAGEEVKARIEVKVEGLVALGLGQHYELVGAPQNHAVTNDPCRSTPPTSQHSRNHYGTAALIAAIQNIATTYGSLHSGVRLRINDMSLESGGLFDIGNRWITGIGEGHAEHRMGENADVGFKGIDAGYRFVNISPDDLLPLIKRYTTGQPKRHDDHYHIRIR
jgi:hypothetical protein